MKCHCCMKLHSCFSITTPRGEFKLCEPCFKVVETILLGLMSLGHTAGHYVMRDDDIE